MQPHERLQMPVCQQGPQPEPIARQGVEHAEAQTDHRQPLLTLLPAALNDLKKGPLRLARTSYIGGSAALGHELFDRVHTGLAANNWDIIHRIPLLCRPYGVTRSYTVLKCSTASFGFMLKTALPMVSHCPRWKKIGRA